MLAGRDIYLGPGNFVSTHGMGAELGEMQQKLKNAYSGSYQALLSFCEENDIDYVYVGSNERGSLDINESAIGQLEKVHTEGSESLYKVN